MKIVLRNHNDPGLSEANFRSRLCHSKQLLKNVHPAILVSFLVTHEKMFTLTTPKNPQNDQLYVYPSIKKDIATETPVHCT